METENTQVHREDEEEEPADNMESLECPYKKFKFDTDLFENASFVTTIEESKGVNSNGDEYGTHCEFPNTSDLNVHQKTVEREGDGEGGSENGEELVSHV
jgi:hypothetical protein